MPKYLVYIDESGDFTQRGYNSISLLLFNAEEKEKLESQFQSILEDPGKALESFHATNLHQNQKLEIERKFLDCLNDIEGQVYNYILHLKTISYDCYEEMLMEAITRTIITKLSRDCRFDIYIESRNDSYDFQTMKEVIRKYVFERWGRKTDLCIRIFNVPKNDNVFMAMADLSANVAYSRANGKIPARSNQSISTVVLKKSELDKAVAKKREIVRKKEALIEDVNAKSKELEVIKIENAKSPEVIAEEIIQTIENSKVESINTKLDKNWDRSEVRDSIYERLSDLLKNRNAVLVSTVSSGILKWLSNSGFEGGSRDIDTVKLATFYAKAENNKGNYAYDMKDYSNIDEIVETLRVNPQNWAEVIEYTVARAIAYQNVFDFEKALLETQKHVAYFDKLKHSDPLYVSGRFIGELYGTHALSLLFQAHSNADYADKYPNMNQIEEVLSYSEFAQTQFEKSDDKQRHVAYQAQGRLMRSMFSGADSDCTLALKTLDDNYSFSELFETFIEKQEDLSTNEIYILAIYLKAFWLKGDNKILSSFDLKKLKKSLKKISYKHPSEQILGYIALLAGDKLKRVSTLILKNLESWKGIVRLIAVVFLLQIEWEESRTLNTEYLDTIFEGINEKASNNLNKSRFKEKLLRVNSSGYTGKGPIEFLPFNYS